MAPMVVLGAHDALPGRYWGEGQGPSASPSQASILLARLNERARERKAGVRRGILGVGQGKPGEGQGGQEGLGAEQRTPGHRTATAENRKLGEHIEEGKDTVLKDQYYSPEPKQMQPGGEIESRVNGVKTEESCTGEVKNVKKKKRRRDEEKREGTGDSEAQEILTAQKEGLVSLLDGGGSVALITKKKIKREESQWEQELKPVISKTVDSSEESTLIKIKKEEAVHKNEIGAVVEESTLMKRKKKNKNEDHVDAEMEISGGRDENYSETSENQRKKKKRKRGREVEETVDRKVENAQSVQLNDSQEEEDISLTSPGNKKNNKKDKKNEAKEEEGVEYQSSQDISSSFKAQKRKIKEEIGETNEDLEIEQKEEELPINRHEVVGGDKERRKDGHDVGMKKGKKKKKKTKREQPKSSEVEGFTLLTEVDASKRQKVQRTLPDWLANPTVIGRDLMADGATVDSLPGLDSSLKDILKQQNIQQLFPVQRTVIPEILASAGTLACRYQPRDVCVSAPTGSGKTLAYVLPLVQTLKRRTVPRIRALVLLPVQELATQVYRVFQTYCRGTPLRVGKAVGHSTLQKEQAALVAQNLDRYHSLIDILVATPGRLADHIRMTCGFDLSALRYLVLDEADHMLAAEGGEWVGHVQRTIADHQAVWENQPLPRPRLQRLLFSATLSSDPEQLQHLTLHHPKLFTVAARAAGQDKSVAVVIGQYVRPAELREEYVVVEEEVKPLALHHLLVSGERRQRVLVFTNSVHTTHKLALLLAALSQGSSRVVSEFSSKRDKRQQIVSQFAAGKIDVLVSSDAMARGLDIHNIDHVVSYDVTSTTTYVHRIGRTARAGRPGTALSLVTKSTVSEFRQALSGGCERACQLSLAAEELEPYEQQYIDALASLKATLAEEEQQKRQNLQNGKRKKSKNKQKKKQRKQKRDLRTAQLAQKASKGKGKVSVNANRLHHLKRW